MEDFVPPLIPLHYWMARNAAQLQWRMDTRGRSRHAMQAIWTSDQPAAPLDWTFLASKNLAIIIQVGNNVIMHIEVLSNQGIICLRRRVIGTQWWAVDSCINRSKITNVCTSTSWWLYQQYFLGQWWCESSSMGSDQFCPKDNCRRQLFQFWVS